MRDPERIGRITWKIAELWQLNQDNRFGQLLENYIYPAKLVRHKSISIVDYQLEDDKLERHLDKVIKMVRNRLEREGVGKTARRIKW